CSGKVYFDLDARRKKLGLRNVAIVRIEQLYPWPEEEIARITSAYDAAKHVLWVQEESHNRGGWHFVHGRFAVAGGIECICRKASPSPATGSFREHTAELETILDHAFAHAVKAAGNGA
ncbi:MAG: hypothetical protein MI724_11025, partial [Spirochaetales bacterium]|nr:hypothetical protein [Spirochaetales bacterium]